MKIKWGSEDMGKRNDKARDKDVDKGNKKYVSVLRQTTTTITSN